MNPKPTIPHRSFEEQYGPLIEMLDLPTIVAQAESLRPGHPCKGPESPVIGDRGQTNFETGTNIHIPIEFDDGRKWMVRVRGINAISPPFEVRKAEVLSEAATFKRLYEAGVKVPQVWLPSQWTNEALYYFVDFVEGAYHPFMNSSLPEEPDDDLKTIIRDLADFQISLERVHHDSVGSLTLDQEGSIVVGPLVEMVMINTQAPFHLGPFKSTKDRYLASIDHRLRMIAEDAYCTPSKSLPMYLALLEARSLVVDCKEMDEGPTYICHGEPKGDHILVDERCNITAVIDWDWSYLSCKAEAFAAPAALLNGSALRFDNELSPREKYLRDAYLERGRPDLARYVEGSRKWLRLNSILLGANAFKVLITARQAFHQGSGRVEENIPGSEGEWRQEVIARYPEDPILQRLLVKYS